MSIGLGVDESYMVAAGRDLSWSYFDHPPLSWWLSAGAAKLAGSEAALVVRAPFIALFALSTWLMARLATDLFGDRAGWWAALAFNLAPVFGLTTGGWVLPDGPLVASLLAAGLCLRRALEGRHPSWWLGAGAAAGLALLSKYSAGLVMLGAVAAMIAEPAWRHHFRRPWPWLAGLVALLFFSPVIAWNASHGWASFAFQGGRAGASRLIPWGPLVVLAGAAAFLLPWIWAGLLAGLARGLRRRAGRGGFLLACLALPPIALFATVALWSRNPLFHWSMPGYLFLFPLLGAGIADWRPVRRWAIVSATLLAVAVPLAVAEVRANWLAWFRPGFDPAWQAVDWTPLAPALAARGLADMPVAALSWLDAGKIGYALGPANRMIVLNPDARQFGQQLARDRATGGEVLIIAPRRDAARVQAEVGAQFERVEALPPLMLALPGRVPAPVPILLGTGLRPR